MNVVSFAGSGGQESRGIVDLMAIRKDHRATAGTIQRGDVFEIILIQVKGGTSAPPSGLDIDRLRSVARRYAAKVVVLSEWKKGKTLRFYRLTKRAHAPWQVVPDIGRLFR